MDTQPNIPPSETTILAVDDTPPNLRLLVGLLMSHGYTVSQAEDGRQALQVVAESPPDLILLDIFMPEMDGYEVCEQLKADPATRDIPVIFISALNEIDNVVKGFDVGGVDYITKPFNTREVLARVFNQITMARQRQQIEAMHEKERQRYETLNTMKNRFIHMATHDLNNPLNVILGYAMMLEELEVTEPDRPFLAEAVKNVQTAANKMRRLVTEMLELAQLEIQTALDCTEVSLADFVQKSVDGFKLMAEQKDITLNHEPPSEDVKIRVDEGRMSRVLDNLLSNAVKYTPAGGSINLAETVEDDVIQIEIADTGYGIPEEDLPRLFEAFYRVRRDIHKAVNGTGLGLAVVKTIVEQHNGQIKVFSELDKGTTFVISLPQTRPTCTTP
jgi:two-component system sensor histidine kinase/response regulator